MRAIAAVSRISPVTVPSTHHQRIRTHGWIAGVRLENGITQSWSAKIEYDYLSFGSQPLNFATATPTA